MSNRAPRFVQPYVPGRNAAAAARPKARRTEVRWLGVARLSLSGVTRRRASRASQGRGAAGAGRGRSCDSGMIFLFYAGSQAYPTQIPPPKEVSSAWHLGRETTLSHLSTPPVE